MKRRRFLMSGYMNTQVNEQSCNALPGFMMPQGRALTAGDRDEMRDLLDKVFAGP